MLRPYLLPFLALLLLCSDLPARAAFPEPRGLVVDQAQILTSTQQQQLAAILTSFQKKTGAQVAVVTVPNLDGLPVEQYATELFAKWGIGGREKNDGLLFLIAPNERKMRIEVGYGLEGVLNDAKAGRLLDEHVIPFFKTGDMPGGIISGTIALVETLARADGIEFDARAAAEQEGISLTPAEEHTNISFGMKLLIIIILIIIILKFPGGPFMFFPGGFGFGGRGRGGFGGGFGGFGGGSSGGGGASRGW